MRLGMKHRQRRQLEKARRQARRDNITVGIALASFIVFWTVMTASASHGGLDSSHAKVNACTERSLATSTPRTFCDGKSIRVDQEVTK